MSNIEGSNKFETVLTTALKIPGVFKEIKKDLIHKWNII